MADIQVANTDSDLSGNTVVTEENAYTITGLHTFDRDPNAPFAVASGSAVVANLDADLLDGQEGAYYLAAANATGTLAVNRGGTGAATFTDGGVLLGSGTSAITAMAVLSDGQMIVGNGSTDPVAESGATLRTSIGVGTGDSPQFTGLTISGTGASALDVGGGINAGTGDVALVGTDGRINGPLSSTIIDDLSAANLTAIPAGALTGNILDTSTGPHSIGGSSVDYARLQLVGAFSSGGASTVAFGTYVGGAITGHADDSAGIFGTRLDNSVVTAGNATTVAQLSVNEPQITVGSGTVTNSAAIYVDAVATEATNDYGVWINAGDVRIDEDLGVGTETPNYTSASRAITLQATTQARMEIVGTRTSDDVIGEVLFMNRVSGSNNNLGIIKSNRSGANNSGSLTFHTYNAGSNVTAFTLSKEGNATIAGSITKGSSTFRIDHPLPSKTDTNYLVHSILEGPRCDLLYRGQVALVDGTAEVDLDEAAGMTTGTWVLLCRDEQVFTTNETGWHHVRGSVSGSTLIIDCEEDCDDVVSWMVVAERQDTHIKATSWTDEDGRPILEPAKPPEPEENE
jgi:hypothetical protein